MNLTIRRDELESLRHRADQEAGRVTCGDLRVALLELAQATQSVCDAADVAGVLFASNSDGAKPVRGGRGVTDKPKMTLHEVEAQRKFIDICARYPNVAVDARSMEHVLFAYVLDAIANGWCDDPKALARAARKAQR